METMQLQIYPDGRLDAKNAAKYIGMSVKTLAQWRSKGKGPKFVKLGRIFYFRDELDDWIHKVGSIQSTAQSQFQEQNLHLVKQTHKAEVD